MAPSKHNPSTSRPAPVPPAKQRMALGLRNLVDSAKRFVSSPSTPQNEKTGTATLTELFPTTVPEVDGDDCSHDCESCHVSYPRGFKIDESDLLYGHIKGWSTHVLVATSKSDWVRDVEDEKGSVMQAFGKADKPKNGRLMLSASNMPTPSHSADYSEPTTVLVLPAFRIVEGVRPADVPRLVEWINDAPTNISPLAPVSLPMSIPAPAPDAQELLTRPSPHAALILLCSQKTRDARCGQSAPLLRKELERHLRPLGLFRDLDDERPGGVGIYFISHVGGHKYSANVMVYRRPDAFGVDGVERAKLAAGEELKPAKKAPRKREPVAEIEVPAEGGGEGEKKEAMEEGEDQDVGAGQCIWLARVKPEDCENLVKYTILQGKVVKPDSQLRGGFDREKGLMSW
ncbi:putative Sucrase/ferredoxin-like-domain-containing protein [Seiridium cardinale]